MNKLLFSLVKEKYTFLLNLNPLRRKAQIMAALNLLHITNTKNTTKCVCYFCPSSYILTQERVEGKGDHPVINTVAVELPTHGLINYKDTKTNCHYLKY
jgi:hypothetical protein